MSALFEAVKDGDIDEIERLLEQGANPNAIGESRETLLHEAVRLRLSKAVALLLAHGADFTITDALGRRPLSQNFTTLETLHAVRQHYQRLPLPSYKNAVPTSPDVVDTVRRLKQDGFAKVSGFINAEKLNRLRSEFERFIRKLKVKHMFGRASYRHYDEEEYWSRHDQMFLTNNAFKYSVQLLRLCCYPFLVETSNYYLGKPAFVQRAMAMRYLPGGRMGNDQFRWHHDMEDTRLKFMILLTDVGKHDQYMTYVRGSHKLFHSYERFLHNQLDLEYCHRHLSAVEILEATGKAGDMILFDSNGIHSANRSKGVQRDVFLLEFSADRYNVWGGDLPKDRPRPEPCAALDRFLAATPMWKRTRGRNRREATGWATSLDRPELWV
jgi:ectoine hydroxylase-related dioxygenase (phytanoyl-CoA dioxygenase family)